MKYILQIKGKMEKKKVAFNLIFICLALIICVTMVGFTYALTFDTKNADVSNTITFEGPDGIKLALQGNIMMGYDNRAGVVYPYHAMTDYSFATVPTWDYGEIKFKDYDYYNPNVRFAIFFTNLGVTNISSTLTLPTVPAGVTIEVTPSVAYSTTDSRINKQPPYDINGITKGEQGSYVIILSLSKNNKYTKFPFNFAVKFDLSK